MTWINFLSEPRLSKRRVLASETKGRRASGTRLEDTRARCRFSHTRNLRERTFRFRKGASKKFTECRSVGRDQHFCGTSCPGIGAHHVVEMSWDERTREKTLCPVNREDKARDLSVEKRIIVKQLTIKTYFGLHSNKKFFKQTTTLWTGIPVFLGNSSFIDYQLINIITLIKLRHRK